MPPRVAEGTVAIPVKHSIVLMVRSIDFEGDPGAGRGFQGKVDSLS